MIIKKATYKKVLVERNEIVTDDIYGCDCCKKELTERPLTITIFKKYDTFDNKKLDFCSWKCVLKHLPKVRTDYFITLPYVMFDKRNKDYSGKELIKILKTIECQ